MEEGKADDKKDKDAPESVTPGKKKKEHDRDNDFGAVREKDGKKYRLEDPKEMIKTDYQLQQSLNYLKAWHIFEVADPAGKETRAASSK